MGAGARKNPTGLMRNNETLPCLQAAIPPGSGPRQSGEQGPGLRDWTNVAPWQRSQLAGAGLRIHYVGGKEDERQQRNSQNAAEQVCVRQHRGPGNCLSECSAGQRTARAGSTTDSKPLG